ncbi:WecB/TagA/CpsF family glycosyltransferase [bacterium]|nr:WecB/TagA/CpsF family glycosyltransferase [bacterium]
MQRRQQKLLGYNIDLFNMQEAKEYVNSLIDAASSSHIVTINPEIIEFANKHENFAKILNEAELVIPDGIGIKIGLKINGINIQRITGIGFARALIEDAAKNSIPIALVGAKPSVIEKVQVKLKEEFPDLNIVYAHDGYFKENSELHEDLKTSAPKILFVAMGVPKQEEFIYELKSILPSTLMIGIGGSFDVWSGEVQRAPEIWQKLGLEWLYRTIKQPERFKRIFPTLPLFVYNVIKERLTKKG